MFLKFVIENHSQLSVFNGFCSLSSGSPIKDSQYQRSKATGFCYFAARKCDRAFIFCNAIFKNRQIFAYCTLYSLDPYYRLAISATTNLQFFPVFWLRKCNTTVNPQQLHKTPKCFWSLSYKIIHNLWFPMVFVVYLRTRQHK